MPREPLPKWDRSADLDRIRATYVDYAADGRERLWDMSNAGYARLSHDLGQRLLSAIRKSLPHERRGRVLDLGCGTGRLVDDVVGAGMGPAWIGVDLRQEAVAEARVAYPGVDFLAASADDLPLEDRSVDVVVAQLLFSSLPSVPLERAVAREIGRVLCPGGWLVWLDLRYDNPVNRAVHGIDARRLGSLFPGWAVQVERAGLLPPLARRLGLLAPVAYPALAAVPPLRSHLVGRLRPQTTP